MTVMGEAEHIRVCSAYYESWVVEFWVLDASLLGAVGHGCSVLRFVGQEGSLGHEQHQAQRTVVSFREVLLPLSLIVSIPETAATDHTMFYY